MNKVTRRIRELKTGLVKQKRIGKYPHDINLKIRDRQSKKIKKK